MTKIRLAVCAAYATQQSNALLLPTVTQSSTRGNTLTRDESTIPPYIKRTITLRVKNMVSKRSSLGLTYKDLLPQRWLEKCPDASLEKSLVPSVQSISSVLHMYEIFTSLSNDFLRGKKKHTHIRCIQRWQQYRYKRVKRRERL